MTCRGPTASGRPRDPAARRRWDPSGSPTAAGWHFSWLEAAGWTLVDPLLREEAAGRLGDYVARTCTMLSEAQADDGYLNSYYQVLSPGRRFADLQWGLSSTAPVN